MSKVLNGDIMAGLEKVNEPRPVGDVLNEMFSSDSPLAKGYRKYLAAKENGAEKGDRL